MYTEIFRLQEMLDDAGIPYEMTSGSPVGWITGERYQICYPTFSEDERVISVIEGDYTYGAGNDLLEIMGLLTDEELEVDDVCGFLTAEEVFSRIKTHFFNQNHQNQEEVK